MVSTHGRYCTGPLERQPQGRRQLPPLEAAAGGGTKEVKPLPAGCSAQVDGDEGDLTNRPDSHRGSQALPKSQPLGE